VQVIIPRRTEPRPAVRPPTPDPDLDAGGDEPQATKLATPRRR
jgi:hypothetical protein